MLQGGWCCAWPAPCCETLQYSALHTAALEAFKMRAPREKTAYFVPGPCSPGRATVTLELCQVPCKLIMTAAESVVAQNAQHALAVPLRPAATAACSCFCALAHSGTLDCCLVTQKASEVKYLPHSPHSPASPAHERRCCLAVPLHGARCCVPKLPASTSCLIQQLKLQRNKLAVNITGSERGLCIDASAVLMR